MLGLYTTAANVNQQRWAALSFRHFKFTVTTTIMQI